MADSGWDNGGHGVPVKVGLPLWGKVALGCGTAFLIVLVTCVGGAAFLTHRFKKDPEGFKQKALGLVADKMRPDWEDFRAVVEQLRSPAGCRALYAAHPDLAQTWATEADFLQAAATWQKDLVPVPELGPGLLEEQGLRIHHELGGRVEVGWSPRGGRAVYVTFAAARRAGDPVPRRVTAVEVR